MAVLAHPTLGAGGVAPTGTTELVAMASLGVPPIIPNTGNILRHPEPSLLSSSSGGGDAAVGYAS